MVTSILITFFIDEVVGFFRGVKDHYLNQKKQQRVARYRNLRSQGLSSRKAKLLSNSFGGGEVSSLLTGLRACRTVRRFWRLGDLKRHVRKRVARLRDLATSRLGRARRLKIWRLMKLIVRRSMEAEVSNGTSCSPEEEG